MRFFATSSTHRFPHLKGNVSATLSDRRVAGTCTDAIVDFYDADILSINDDAPLGAVMEGRGQRTRKYRFGFNGQEHLFMLYNGKGLVINSFIK